MDRRAFLKQTALVSVAAMAGLSAQSCAQPGKFKKPYNVLFIAVDDLNDWVGCLGGHPQAKTPNIDKLAAKGVLFERAYCAAPLCNPSRTAIMTGLNPSTSGVYCNKGWFREHPKYQDWQTIPQYFRSNGYTAETGGKIYHHPGGRMSDPVAWNRQYHTGVGTPNPPKNERYQHGMKGKFTTSPYFNNAMDWAPLRQTDEQTADWKTADLAGEFLQQDHDKPFFLGCGIFRPHLSWYAPKKYFDMFLLDDIQLPPYKENDLDDVPAMGKRLARKDFPVIKEHKKWKEGVRAYLACCAFADACVGHVLDALETSAYRDNTIVVLWGDHGWNLGEKDHWSKFALWEDTSRTPLVIYAPGQSKQGGRCTHPVSLVNLYPTLIDLCGLPKRDDLDGRSLKPLLENPKTDWPWPAVMTHWRNNHAIRSDRYRYISYRDGGEELYDHTIDPYEWNNLADDPKHAKAKAALKKHLPTVNAEHFQAEAPENM